MPSSPTPMCRDCGKRSVANGYCADHQSDNSAAQHKRLYDIGRQNDPVRKLYRKKRWQATRSVVLRRDILCQWPDGCPHAATVADHYPLRARVLVEQLGTDAFYDPSRCRGLCKQHHDQHTVAEESGWAGNNKL